MEGGPVVRSLRWPCVEMAAKSNRSDAVAVGRSLQGTCIEIYMCIESPRNFEVRRQAMHGA
jgi:hypothetical protein